MKRLFIFSSGWKINCSSFARALIYLEKWFLFWQFPISFHIFWHRLCKEITLSWWRAWNMNDVALENWTSSRWYFAWWAWCPGYGIQFSSGTSLEKQCSFSTRKPLQFFWNSYKLLCQFLCQMQSWRDLLWEMYWQLNGIEWVNEYWIYLWKVNSVFCKVPNTCTELKEASLKNKKLIKSAESSNKHKAV